MQVIVKLLSELDSTTEDVTVSVEICGVVFVQVGQTEIEGVSTCEMRVPDP